MKIPVLSEMVKGKLKWGAYIDGSALIIRVYLHTSAGAINQGQDLNCELIALFFSKWLLIRNDINLAKIIEL